MQMKAVIVVLLLLTLPGFFRAFGADKSTSAWLAFGDLRGYLEPCGCDPATDMGGVKRISTILKRERLQTPDLSVFGLGNALPPTDDFDLKIPFLLEAEGNFRTTATLFNALEIKNATLLSSELSKSKVKPTYVLSNLRGSEPWHIHVKKLVVTNREVVLGYVQAKSLAQVDRAMLSSWEKLLQDNDVAKNKLRVLLYSGGSEDLQKIAKSGIFDAIISSNTAVMEEDPGIRDKNNEDLLIRDKAKDIWMVPLGGQGVLRGGGARSGEAVPFEQLLKKSEPSKLPVNLFAAKKFVTWLMPDIPDDDELKDLFQRYNQAAKNAFNATASQRVKDFADSSYVGAAACATCHPSAYEVWKVSKHAHAMKTLEDKGKDRNAECVACHVVGAKEKGGFVSMEQSPILANVQCEVCHGPRKEHAANPPVKPKLSIAASDVCITCHNSSHSPRFKKTDYWQQIKHSTVP